MACVMRSIGGGRMAHFGSPGVGTMAQQRAISSGCLAEQCVDAISVCADHHQTSDDHDICRFDLHVLHSIRQIECRDWPRIGQDGVLRMVSGL